MSRFCKDRKTTTKCRLTHFPTLFSSDSHEHKEWHHHLETERVEAAVETSPGCCVVYVRADWSWVKPAGVNVDRSLVYFLQKADVVAGGNTHTHTFWRSVTVAAKMNTICNESQKAVTIWCIVILHTRIQLRLNYYTQPKTIEEASLQRFKESIQCHVIKYHDILEEHSQENLAYCKCFHADDVE